MKKMFILLILSLFISSSCIEEMKAQEKKTSLSDKITFIDGEEMEAKYFVDSCVKAFGSINSKDLCVCFLNDLGHLKNRHINLLNLCFQMLLRSYPQNI